MNISLSDARLIFNTPKGTLMIVAFDSASSKPYEELVDRTLKENAKQGFRRDGEPYYMLHKKDIPLDNEKGQHFRRRIIGKSLPKMLPFFIVKRDIFFM